MRFQFLFSSLAICLLFAACQPTNETSPDLKQVKSDIQAVSDTWAAALNNKNLDALMAHYTEDAISMSDARSSIVGKAAIRQHQEKDMAQMSAGSTYTFETQEVYAQGDAVTELGKTTVKNAEGKVTSTGKYMCIWKKQQGKYVCSREIYNNDSGPAPAGSKSLHLFDLPAGVTEAEWSAALREMNSVVADMGYPNAGYFLYKTEGDDVKDYRYFFEGVWPSSEAYTKIHESPEWVAASKKMNPLYEKIKAVEMYRRVVRVE